MSSPNYTPTTWVDDSAPAIDADNLNNIEQGIVAVDDAAVAGLATKTTPAAAATAAASASKSADTITDGTTNKAFLATERTKLAGIATGATVGPTVGAAGSGAGNALSANDATTTNTRTPSASSIVDAMVSASAAISVDKTADGTTNKVYSATDKTKLAGITAQADPTGTTMNGATAKTTPVDADTMPLSDSAASGALKKVTWANIKATIKALTDTLYFTLSSITTKGDLLVGTGAGTVARFPAGADGTVLGYDSTQTTGLKTLTAATLSTVNAPVPVLGRGSSAIGSLSVAQRADAQLVAPGLDIFWGTGSDGDVVLDGTTTFSGVPNVPGATVLGTSSWSPSASTYTAPRSMFFHNLTINSGVTLIVPTGMIIYCSGTLTNNGTITWSGANASGATAGAAATSGANGIFGAGAAGGNGATGAGSGTASTLDSYWVAAQGGTGGTGSSGAGGSGSNSQNWASANPAGSIGAAFTLFTGCQIGLSSQIRPLGGGNGGGGGGGDSTHSGGGGGGGAGVGIINAKTIVNGGTIKANGGNGAAGVAANAGGGAGGAGGALLINTVSYTNTGTVTANGGTGGAGAGTGTAGGTGSNGPVIVTQWAS